MKPCRIWAQLQALVAERTRDRGGRYAEATHVDEVLASGCLRALLPKCSFRRYYRSLPSGGVVQETVMRKPILSLMAGGRRSEPEEVFFPELLFACPPFAPPLLVRGKSYVLLSGAQMPEGR